MIKASHSFIHFIFLFFIPIIFLSCRNNTNIPFPENELGYTRPVTVPLQFTAEKKLKWDTVKKGAIKPVVSRLDIDALPSVPYDTTGFKPFLQSPEETNFDYDALPAKDFNLNKLPSQSLDLKISVLPPVAVTSIGKMIAQKGKALSIYDMAQFHGVQGQLIGAFYTDKDGLLWIGGTGGLFRYDGENIQTIIEGNSGFAPITGITEDDLGNVWFIQAGGNIGVINMQNGTIGYSKKIVGVANNITKMAKDDEGNIWVYNAREKAVDIINPAKGTYKNIDAKSLADLSAAQIALPQTSFQVIQASDKKIWITTFLGGVDIIDPLSGKIKFLRKGNGIESDTISAIAEDKRNGLIWLATPGGLDAVDLKNRRLKHYGNLQKLNPAQAIDLFCDDEGQVWKGTVANGIELLDPANAETRNIKQADGIIGNVIITFYEDEHRRIWVATNAGLNRIDQHAITTHPVGTTQIISLMEDEMSNLWVATQNGLLIVNPKRNGAHLLDKAHGLSDNFVQSFWNINGNMVVATDGGYNIIDPINKTLKKVGKNEGLVNDTVYTVFGDSYGNKWVTGPSNGVDFIDSARNLILHADSDGGLSDDFIGDVRQDKEGMIWLATNKGGINVIDPAKGTVKYLNDQPGLKDTCNRILLEDQYGRMWIGTDKGIYVADTKRSTLIIIGNKQGLSNAVVTSLLPYKAKVLAGTNNKVNLITAAAPGDTSKNWKVSVLNNSEDLLRVNITSWETDAVTREGEFLWGDNGITIVKNIKPVVDSNRICITGINVMTRPQNFINKNSLSANDTLWMADSFYTKETGYPKNAGYAIGSKFKWDSVAGPYNMPVNLKLPHNENYLQFHFAQASTGRPDSVWYTYILEGIDNNWSLPTINTSTENYLNLPSGHYTFKVSSKGLNGQWSQPACFSFIISPPWYQTWWAYIIYILLGLGILRLYIVYRSRRLQKENRVLEEKVKHRTEQLQKSIEDLKLTQTQLVQSEKMASLGELTAGIAHEIQNPLNFVNNFSEVNAELTDELKEELDKTSLPAEEKTTIEKIIDDIKQNQQKINFHGKRADSIVKGMLQHSRASTGQKESTDINVLCDEYLRLSYHGLRAKDKSFNAKFETDFDPSIPKISIVAQDIGRVILNLINNAFYAVTAKKKTAGEGFEPNVTVITKKLKNGVEIRVKDNGSGIPQSVKDKIFQPFFTTKPAGQGTGLGLSLSYDIITKGHGGEIKVESEEGIGTTFILVIPIV
jgi:signal transduction histidine kinase/ligand-binding sensor domain-containing protein